MQSNRYVIIAIIGVIVIAASFVYINKPNNVDNQDSDEDSQTQELGPEEPETEPTPAGTQSRVKTIIQGYLSETIPQVSKTETENIETIVNDYPVALQTSEAITVQATEGEEIEYTLKIKTQDWVYAVNGVENTLIGGFVDGQEDKLDLGLYSFLKAAALNIDEPEHLSNVAFHLNNKGDYQNAETILQYALTINENYYPALSNLAYAYAGQRDYTNAILAQLKVVSLRPEPWYLLRLADYYEKAGLTEASEAVLNALEGSQEESFTPFPPNIILSSSGEAVMDEIEKLEESLNARLIAISDSKALPLYAVMDKLLNDWAEIVVYALYECPMNVASSGGDAYAICVNCYVPGANEAFNLVSTARANVLPAITSFESEAFIELEKHTRQAIAIVEDADLDETEQKVLLDEIHRRFTIEYTIEIIGPRKRVESIWAGIQSDYRAAFAEGCGDIPVEIPELEEVNYECEILPVLCKKWKVWFIVGSVSYDPKTRDFEVSLGQGLEAKYRYNFARDISSVGVGYGINFAKVIQTGGTLYFNPTDGVQGELSAEFSPPVPMFIPDTDTSVSTSKPLFSSLMN
jgi:tetratricopeptide (TPR) repeat protein